MSGTVYGVNKLIYYFNKNNFTNLVAYRILVSFRSYFKDFSIENTSLDSWIILLIISLVLV